MRPKPSPNIVGLNGVRRSTRPVVGSTSRTSLEPYRPELSYSWFRAPKTKPSVNAVGSWGCSATTVAVPRIGIRPTPGALDPQPVNATPRTNITRRALTTPTVDFGL